MNNTNSMNKVGRRGRQVITVDKKSIPSEVVLPPNLKPQWPKVIFFSMDIGKRVPNDFRRILHKITASEAWKEKKMKLFLFVHDRDEVEPTIVQERLRSQTIRYRGEDVGIDQLFWSVVFWPAYNNEVAHIENMVRNYPFQFKNMLYIGNNETECEKIRAHRMVAYNYQQKGQLDMKSFDSALHEWQVAELRRRRRYEPSKHEDFWEFDTEHFPDEELSEEEWEDLAELPPEPDQMVYYRHTFFSNSERNFTQPPYAVIDLGATDDIRTDPRQNPQLVKFKEGGTRGLVWPEPDGSLWGNEDADSEDLSASNEGEEWEFDERFPIRSKLKAKMRKLGYLNGDGNPAHFDTPQHFDNSSDWGEDIPGLGGIPASAQLVASVMPVTIITPTPTIIDEVPLVSVPVAGIESNSGNRQEFRALRHQHRDFLSSKLGVTLEVKFLFAVGLLVPVFLAIGAVLPLWRYRVIKTIKRNRGDVFLL